MFLIITSYIQIQTVLREMDDFGTVDFISTFQFTYLLMIKNIGADNAKCFNLNYSCIFNWFAIWNHSVFPKHIKCSDKIS